MSIKNIAYWWPLILAAIGVLGGSLCYRVEKYIIGADSKLNKFSASPNSILIKLKFFKYDWHFNYLLLIPYLISIAVFVLVLLLYILYWIGITQIACLIWTVWFNGLLRWFIFFNYVYAAIIRMIILHYG